MLAGLTLERLVASAGAMQRAHRDASQAITMTSRTTATASLEKGVSGTGGGAAFPTIS